LKLNLKKITALALAASMVFSTAAFADEIKTGEESAAEQSQQSEEEVSDDIIGEEAAEIKPWSDYFVISHACGAVDGRVETNSLEAFEQNYEKGQRVFEMDFILTLDNKLVARHDFEQNSYYVMEQTYNKKIPVMMHQMFINMPINYKYTPMDIDMVVEQLNNHKDAYIVTDSKNTDKETIEKEFQLMKEAVERTGNDEIFDRIVVQIYYPEMQEYIRNIGGFKNFMLTTYQIQNPDFNELAEFCVKNDIGAVVVPFEALTEKKAEVIHNAGLKLYTHTLNRLYDVKKCIDMYGIDGVYSDYLVESDIDYIK